MRLSVVVITRNEERDIPGCLASVKGIASEIIVLDSGSTDKTRALATAAGAAVLHRPFDDFASHKQAAVDAASGDWILSLDADERVGEKLADEIKEAMTAGRSDAFDIPFQIWFMGKHLRFGGLGGEHHIRLFRRGAGRFAGDHLHEGIVVEGSVGRMRHAISHHPYRDLNEYLDKMAAYTDRAAKKRYALGKRFHPLYHALPLWEFFMRTVLKGGLLDGHAGVLWAGLSSFHTWLKYMKLRELEHGGGA